MKKVQNGQAEAPEGQAADNRDEVSSWTQWYLRIAAQRPTRFFFLLLVVYVFINNTITASSVWMEATRGDTPSIALWEPFVWEYTSMLANLMLVPVLLWFWQRYPLRFSKPTHQILMHLGLSLAYAILHVCGMVLLREGAYWFAGGNYDFGPWVREFIYEYRKDVWGYLFVLLLYHVFMALYRRMLGEANFINESQNDSPKDVPQHLLVRKLDKEFLVKVEDVSWLEASGNYVNLHANGRIYPLRTTLAEIVTRLSHQFVRVHRSKAVNLAHIEHITYTPSGDGEIVTKRGDQLPLSRRYKDAFKQRLSL
ncbi:LytR/AlgR family response regulator transcription factor [Alteromonas flava]|uniref:LytR/AlgR family response regulator transcription factor n=1 Tax=Alteromonas flava TaxID=2048003 RepID=UPI000C28E67E|nr:LytTR family DNA-binding domain-containing protein [Alteromonas flava]